MKNKNFKQLVDVFKKKYKKVEYYDSDVDPNISIEPFSTDDVTFFVFSDGGYGWNQYLHSEDMKPVGEGFPSIGTSDEDIIKVVEDAIAKYKKERQEFFNECTNALVKFNGWTREETIRYQIDREQMFTVEWMKEMDIK